MFKKLIAGFALLWLSKAFESWGDRGATGTERLPGHLIALIVLIAAGTCFVLALRDLIRSR